jgi:hypothetical protein
VCSMDSKAAVVSVVSDFIPTVKITGPAVRTVYRTAALSLFAQVSICSLDVTPHCLCCGLIGC